MSDEVGNEGGKRTVTVRLPKWLTWRWLGEWALFAGLVLIGAVLVVVVSVRIGFGLVDVDELAEGIAADLVEAVEERLHVAGLDGHGAGGSHEHDHGPVVAEFDPASWDSERIEIAMDPTCPWCRRQHGETDAMRSAGWDVVYVPYARAGVESASGRAMASAWCSGGVEAVAALFSSDVLPVVDGEPCEDGMAWVREGRRRLDGLGVNATPTMVADGGRLFSGYRPASDFGSRN